MRVQLRIVAGSLRGRKINSNVNPQLRPTPQMVREALFSILGNAVPDRPFIDVFSGTGVIGLEALSRGATSVTFIERDFRLARDIEQHLQAFELKKKATILRSDAYRWAASWQPPQEPINVFLSPPFSDLENKVVEFLELIRTLQQKLFTGSVLVVQSEKDKLLDVLPDLDQWDKRHYGRNLLLIWVKEEPQIQTGSPQL